MRGPVLGRLAARLVWKGVALATAGFAVLAASSVAGYVAAYPTTISRARLDAQIRGNLGFQAIYGRSYGIDTIGGFAAWRVGGLTVLVAAVWGALSATRLLRGEEEAGRVELLLAGPTTARSWFDHVVAVLLGGQAVAAVGLWFGLVVTGVPVAGAGLLAVAVGTSGFVGVGCGALSAQCLPTRRRAAVWAGGALGGAYLFRVLADGSDSLRSLRWVTPFGWTEEIRPFAGDRFWAVGVPLALMAMSLFVARWLAGHRDLQGAVVSDHDSGPARETGVDGIGVLTRRILWSSLRGWALGLGAFAGVMGLLARDVADFARRSDGYADVARRLGISDPASPAAFVGLSFSFLAVLSVAFVASQVIAARTDEADGRIDLLLSQPLGRRRWLWTRTAHVGVGSVVLALVMAATTWSGVEVRGGGLTPAQALAAGMNLLPLAVLVAGVGAAAHGVVPRATAPIAIGFVVVGYLVELVGSLLRAPSWVLDLSPFHHLAPVPAAGWRIGPTLIFVAVGLLGMVVGTTAFARRDLVGA